MTGTFRPEEPDAGGHVSALLMAASGSDERAGDGDPHHTLH